MLKPISMSKVRSARVNVEGNSDRLSSLPDDIVHKILSFISVKDAIGMSVLSSRWRFTWTLLPCLNFEFLKNREYLDEFVDNVLSHRNNQIQVSSVKLHFGRNIMNDPVVDRICDCAFSHNVQQLSFTRPDGEMCGCPCTAIDTPKWDLPALTTLHFDHVKLFYKPNKEGNFFSKCTNLKNLFLRRCVTMSGQQVLDICTPRLVNLTIEHNLQEVVNVVAPQLKNLTIRWSRGKHQICAPGLTSLVIEGSQLLQLSTPEGFHSLEKVHLNIYDPFEADANKLVCLLHQLRSVKLLTLNLGILEHLSSFKELIPYKACVFAEAKISKFITNAPAKVCLEVQNVTETEIYETSPNAIFPMVSSEEITIIRDMASARVFVEFMGVLLKQCKENTNSDTNKAHMEEHGKPLVEMAWWYELQWNLEVIIALSYRRKIVAFEDCMMMKWITEKYIRRAVPPMVAGLQEMRSLFERIQQLINQLSASKRALMQQFFLSLCQDATVLTNNMLERMKMTMIIQEPNAPVI